MIKDDIFNKKRETRKRRKEEIINQRPNNWLIICEGTKTEPLYFENIKNKINTHFTDEYKIKIDIKGTGYNTKSLVNLAERIQSTYDKYTRLTSSLYGKVFVVFDKDDFTDKNFMEALSLCKSHDFIPLWSNQAFEYWLILHFNHHNRKIYRADYKKIIEKEMISKTGKKFEYSKSNSNCTDEIIKHGSLKLARKNAKKIHKEFVELNISECKSESCTTIYKFFDEVDKRLELYELPNTTEIFSDNN